MSTLDDLFPDGALRREERVVLDDHHTTRRLGELFGDRRADLDVTHRASDRRGLVAMVNGAASDAKPLSSAPPARGTGRRPRRRPDLINIGMAGVAAIALVTAGVVGGVQAATASPADDALRVLRADEKTIESATAGLESSRTRITYALADDDAKAAALGAAVTDAREAADPADIPEGETDAPEDADRIAIGDAKATDAVLAAVDAYRADLKGFALPEMPAAYAKAGVADDSLTDVAAAIDAAQLQLTAIDRASAEVRQVRTAIDERRAGFATAVATFAATFPAAAKTAIDEHPDAAQEFKDAVTSAADAVAGADLLTDAGAATLAAYRDAAVALAADQVRIERVWERERLEREERERQERERQRRQNPVVPNPGETTAPPTDPTDPTDPDEPTGL